jgi:hypothetical protein
MRISARRNRLLGAGVLGLALLAGCTSGGPAPGAAGPADTAPAPTSSASPPETGPAGGELPRPDHVMVVLFENEDAGDVLGSPDAPYLTSLAATGATFTDAHAETHPSQPNYLALFSGSVQGVDDDACLDRFPGADLGSRLRDAGLSFVGYAEGLPSAGYTGCASGGYARKHNPWVDFADLPPEVNQPLSALPGDFSELPTVAFVVPDLCHSMHDCDVSVGDAWARDVLDPYVAWARDNNSLLLVTFDEDDGSADNHIPAFLVGDGVRATTSDRRIDHYDMLRTLLDMYGLAPLGESADAQPITDVWEVPAGR